MQVAHALLGQALQRHGEHEELVKQQAEHVEMLELQLAAKAEHMEELSRAHAMLELQLAEAVEQLHLLKATSPARGVC